MNTEQMQQEIERLNKKLAIRNKQVTELRHCAEYYGSLANWGVYKNKGHTQEIRLAFTGDCSTHEDAGHILKLGGKLARETVTVDNKLEEEFSNL